MPGDAIDAKDQKTKLTLGISKEVIDRAKAERINISEITENLLKVITYDQGNTRDDLVKAYEAFFAAIQKILKKYGTSISVGETPLFDDTGDIFTTAGITLYPDGLFAELPESGTLKKTSVDNELDSLFSPKKILENLIPQLIKAAERNKAKIKEFEFALRFAEILPDGEADK